ncbi:MAG TPA: hypothetical protein VKH81_07555 [Candidatus Angelobacter sp.]|nr:hypothetical protein [Candidatus Angelobacter sp.]
MNEQETLYYEIPRDAAAKNLKTVAAELLKDSQAEIADILAKHNIPRDKAEAMAKSVTNATPDMDYSGSGSVAEVVAIAVSLAPLIKSLTPLLLPFSKRGADLAYQIGKDIWMMLKKKMLGKNIRLSEKKTGHRK